MSVSPWIITFLVIAFIAITGNTLSIIQLIRLASLNAVTTRLILFLHVSSLVHSIGALPLVYSGNPVLCEIMGFTHFYGGLMNAVSLVLLSRVYLNFTLGFPEKNDFIKRYCAHFTFLFSTITLLPFSTLSYGRSEIWCTLPITNDTSNIWSFAVSYCWVTIALLYSSYVIGYIVYFGRNEKTIAQSIFSAAGIYIVVTWIGLIPGLVPRLLELFVTINLGDAEQFFQRIPSYLASIAYCICFVESYSMFTLYEKHFSRSDSSGNVSLADLEAAVFLAHERTSRMTNDSLRRSDSKLNRVSNISANSVGSDTDKDADNLVMVYLEQITNRKSNQSSHPIHPDAPKRESEMGRLSFGQQKAGETQNPIQETARRI
jgi:hypothetical protein